ncbi:MAG: fibronectin type III-like domain-contianing protein [Paludibacter sp.]|nr:fibronectin type III-like domain-contianing protein [Paludibacter sp.]
MGEKPLFSFGFGLYYTTFNYSNLRLSTPNIKSNDTHSISFDLANTGKFEAFEVAQLYVQDVAASVTRPVKELIQFLRINLKPIEGTHIYLLSIKILSITDKIYFWFDIF